MSVGGNLDGRNDDRFSLTISRRSTQNPQNSQKNKRLFSAYSAHSALHGLCGLKSRNVKLA
jgi:hypothetical protein